MYVGGWAAHVNGETPNFPKVLVAWDLPEETVELFSLGDQQLGGGLRWDFNGQGFDCEDV
jgi:hypothetical protein